MDSNNSQKKASLIQDAEGRSKMVVRDTLQMLVDYYSTNGCVLSKEMADKVSPLVDKRYGLTSERSGCACSDSRSGNAKRS